MGARKTWSIGYRIIRKYHIGRYTCPNFPSRTEQGRGRAEQVQGRAEQGRGREQGRRLTELLVELRIDDDDPLLLLLPAGGEISPRRIAWAGQAGDLRAGTCHRRLTNFFKTGAGMLV